MNRIRPLYRYGSEPSPFEKRVLELWCMGRTYREMSELLGKPKKSIDNAIQRLRARGYIKSHWEREKTNPVKMEQPHE